MRRIVILLLAACFVSVLVLFAGNGRAFAQEETGENEIEQLRRENEALKKQLDELNDLLRNLKATEAQEEAAPDEIVIEEQKRGAEEELQNAMEQLRLQMDDLQLQRENLQQQIEETRRRAEEKVLREQDLLSEFRARYPHIWRRSPYERAPEPAEADVAEAAPYEDSLADMFFASKEMQLEDVMLSHGDVGLATMLRFEKVKLHRKLKEYDRAIRELRAIIDGNLNEVITNAARWTLVEVLQEKKEKDAATAELEKILATTKDTRKKKDAIYGIINLLGDDPQSKLRAIERLINRLEGRPETGYGPPGITFPGPTPGGAEYVPGVIPTTPMIGPGGVTMPGVTPGGVEYVPGVVPTTPAIAPGGPGLLGPTGPTLPGEVAPAGVPVTAPGTLPEPTVRPPVGPSAAPGTLSQPGAPSPAPGTGIPEPISPAPRPTAPSAPSRR